MPAKAPAKAVKAVAKKVSAAKAAPKQAVKSAAAKAAPKPAAKPKQESFSDRLGQLMKSGNYDLSPRKNAPVDPDVAKMAAIGRTQNALNKDFARFSAGQQAKAATTAHNMQRENMGHAAALRRGEADDALRRATPLVPGRSVSSLGTGGAVNTLAAEKAARAAAAAAARGDYSGLDAGTAAALASKEKAQGAEIAIRDRDRVERLASAERMQQAGHANALEQINRRGAEQRATDTNQSALQEQRRKASAALAVAAFRATNASGVGTINTAKAAQEIG